MQLIPHCAMETDYHHEQEAVDMDELLSRAIPDYLVCQLGDDLEPHRNAVIYKLGLSTVAPLSDSLRKWCHDPGSTVFVLHSVLLAVRRDDLAQKLLHDMQKMMPLYVVVEEWHANGQLLRRQFHEVETRADMHLSSALEYFLDGSLSHYKIMGPEAWVSWSTLANDIKGKQLTLRRIPVCKTDKALYGCNSNCYNLMDPKGEINKAKISPNVTQMAELKGPHTMGPNIDHPMGDTMVKRPNTMPPFLNIPPSENTLTPLNMIENLKCPALSPALSDESMINNVNALNTLPTCSSLHSLSMQAQEASGQGHLLTMDSSDYEFTIDDNTDLKVPLKAGGKGMLGRSGQTVPGDETNTESFSLRALRLRPTQERKDNDYITFVSSVGEQEVACGNLTNQDTDIQSQSETFPDGENVPNRIAIQTGYDGAWYGQAPPQHGQNHLSKLEGIECEQNNLSLGNGKASNSQLGCETNTTELESSPTSLCNGLENTNKPNNDDEYDDEMMDNDARVSSVDLLDNASSLNGYHASPLIISNVECESEFENTKPANAQTVNPFLSNFRQPVPALTLAAPHSQAMETSAALTVSVDSSNGTFDFPSGDCSPRVSTMEESDVCEEELPRYSEKKGWDSDGADDDVDINQHMSLIRHEQKLRMMEFATKQPDAAGTKFNQVPIGVSRDEPTFSKFASGANPSPMMHTPPSTLCSMDEMLSPPTYLDVTNLQVGVRDPTPLWNHPTSFHPGVSASTNGTFYQNTPVFSHATRMPLSTAVRSVYAPDHSYPRSEQPHISHFHSTPAMSIHSEPAMRQTHVRSDNQTFGYRSDENYLPPVNDKQGQMVATAIGRLPSAYHRSQWPNPNPGDREDAPSSSGSSCVKEDFNVNYSYIEDINVSRPLPPTTPAPASPAPSHRQPFRQMRMTLDDQLSRIEGWCPRETDATIEMTMRQFKGQNGYYMMWRSSQKARFIISVSHQNDLLHFLIEEKRVDSHSDRLLYYLYKGGFSSEILLDLVNHYISCGIKRCLTQSPIGGKAYACEHIPLRRPLKVRREGNANANQMRN